MRKAGVYAVWTPDELIAGVQYGEVRGGFVSGPVNTAHKGEYLRHQLADSGSRVLFVEPELADRAAAVVGHVNGPDHVMFTLSLRDALPISAQKIVPGPVLGSITWP